MDVFDRRAKEILCQQLELLAEKSKNVEKIDLTDYSLAICRISEAIQSFSDTRE